MDTFIIIILSALEVVALFTIWRLWFRGHRHIISRILWSVVLLIPFFGLLMFVFVGSNPEKNPDRLDTQSDSDAFYGGGGGH